MERVAGRLERRQNGAEEVGLWADQPREGMECQDATLRPDPTLCHWAAWIRISDFAGADLNSPKVMAGALPKVRGKLVRWSYLVR